MKPVQAALRCIFAALVFVVKPAVAQDAISGQVELLELHLGKGNDHFIVDGRLGNALTLEPRIGVGWALQDIPPEDTASGISDMEASVRLRYTLFGRTNAYVGAIHERLLGGTRAIAIASGDQGSVNRAILGLATQF